MEYPPEFIRLYANPKIGSIFTTGRKFNIRTSTRNYIDNMIIKGPNGRKDTETVNNLNSNNIPNHALRNKHHFATYIDNIHLTIFPSNRDKDHLTIAFKDKSRIYVYYNDVIPKVGEKLGFKTGMEGNIPQPPGGGNAHKLAGVFSVIEKTIQPVIIRLFYDPNIQPYLRPDSEPSELKPQSQVSTGMMSTQESQEENNEEESEIDKLFAQLNELPLISDEPQPIVKRTSTYDLRRDERPVVKERSRSKGKIGKRKKTKKRKNKKQKKTKKKKN
jgi:hypothetical protein